MVLSGLRDVHDDDPYEDVGEDKVAQEDEDNAVDTAGISKVQSVQAVLQVRPPVHLQKNVCNFKVL